MFEGAAVEGRVERAVDVVLPDKADCVETGDRRKAGHDDVAVRFDSDASDLSLDPGHVQGRDTIAGESRVSRSVGIELQKITDRLTGRLVHVPGHYDPPVRLQSDVMACRCRIRTGQTVFEIADVDLDRAVGIEGVIERAVGVEPHHQH